MSGSRAELGFICTFSDLSTGHSSARASFIQRWAISSSDARLVGSTISRAISKHCRAPFPVFFGGEL